MFFLSLSNFGGDVPRNAPEVPMDQGPSDEPPSSGAGHVLGWCLFRTNKLATPLQPVCNLFATLLQPVCNPFATLLVTTYNEFLVKL